VFGAAAPADVIPVDDRDDTAQSDDEASSMVCDMAEGGGAGVSQHVAPRHAEPEFVAGRLRA